jgi:predicted nucleotidyltransferase
VSVIIDTVDVGQPYADVVPGARGALLATLAQLAVPVTVRALARHAAVSPQGALQVVNELAAAGIVTVTRAGQAIMVTLNRDHLAAEPILALVGIRNRLVERLTDELARWPKLAGGWLFGSAASGDGHSSSDIDLLLVSEQRPDQAWETACGQLTTQVQAWTGNPTQLVEHTRASFARLVQRRNPLIAALRAEGIALTPTTAELLRGAP